MVVFPCHVCRTQLSADDAQAGQLVRCPTCLTTLRVPAPQAQSASSAVAVGAFAGVGVGASANASAGSASSGGGTGTMAPPRSQFGTAALGAPRPSVGKRYGFNCGYCSSRLEANESMAAQE